MPVEEVVEIRKGQKSISERRFFPGYVLVEMEMNEQTWHLVKNTDKVTGLLAVVQVSLLQYQSVKLIKLWRK